MYIQPKLTATDDCFASTYLYFFEGSEGLTIDHSLERSLQRWKEISGLDFALLTPEGEACVDTGGKKLPDRQKQEAFLEQAAVSKAVGNLHYFKVFRQEEVIYLLIVWGKGVSAHTIGELAVCQIE